MNWRILVVDDSAVARLYLRRILEISGFPIKDFWQAGDGLAAIDILQKQQVDLVITDINMPHMNGEELVQWLKGDDRFKALPVVVVSTDSSAARVQRLAGAG